MVLIGKVKTGFGNASYWMEKAERAFEKKIGIKLYNGTLNVLLEHDFILEGDLKVLYKEEYGGSEDVFLKECEVLGYKSYIVRTKKNSGKNGDHPLSLIEIISDVCFREEYDLKDNDIIEVKI